MEHPFVRKQKIHQIGDDESCRIGCNIMDVFRQHHRDARINNEGYATHNQIRSEFFTMHQDGIELVT